MRQMIEAHAYELVESGRNGVPSRRGEIAVLKPVRSGGEWYEKRLRSLVARKKGVHSPHAPK